MSFIHTHASRRDFMRRSAQLAALSGSPFGLNLALMGAAAAQSSTSAQDAPFRALVCLYMGGGNDNSNTVVPRSGTAYSDYASGRGTALALPAASLLPLSLSGWSGPELGLHPSLVKLQGLVNGGQAAVMANVGTLAQPLNLKQWNNGKPSVAVPIQLFSHSDQSREWQAGVADTFSRTGWLGRAGDLLSARNTGGVPICMSMAGNNAIQLGKDMPYQMGAGGPNQLNNLNGAYGVSGPAFRELITDAKRTNLLERELTRTTRKAIDVEARIRGAITPTAGLAAFAGGGLGAQLRMVARMIAAREALGFKRQIFFVQHGSYDMHSDLLKSHSARLAELDAAVYQFHDTMVQAGMSDKVTLFTMSEFGRSLQSNGDGSDHGWGGHQFIVGGAVKGQRLYGQWPTVKLKGPEDVGNGRLLPSTSVDQYAATLATWLGVSATDLSATVLPNLSHFASSNLGFMGA
jgi:uncharacterized protein (DUF1501 family)